MVNRNLIRHLESETSWEQELSEALSGSLETGLATIEAETLIESNKIVEGRIIRVDNDVVLLDIGYKSEGSIPRREWEEEEEPPVEGAVIQVLVEEVENASGRLDDVQGMVQLSKVKAEKILRWQEMMKSVEEGQVVAAVEAMKAKHDVKAPRKGKVVIIHGELGTEVSAGKAILELEDID